VSKLYSSAMSMMLLFIIYYYFFHYFITGSVHSDEDGFYWYVPMMCVIITIGLALDYDVFLIGRVMEHRRCVHIDECYVVAHSLQIHNDHRPSCSFLRIFISHNYY